jgi:hypothetical protein
MAKQKFPETEITPSHRDYVLLTKVCEAICRDVGGIDKLRARLPEIIKDAVDFVLDPVSTLRTQMSELDKVEKTFIGLKIEHYLRDLIGCEKGSKRDARIADIDIDIKNTIGSTWMIPHDYHEEEPCILIATAKFDGRCWLGLIVARDEYLNSRKGNNDKKRTVSEAGKRNILWLVRDEPYPASRWSGFDMDRFKDLRDSNQSGNKKAAQFFFENLNQVVHKSVIKALLNQDDFMRRVRSDTKQKGTREILAEKGIVLLCGTWPESKQIAHDAGIPALLADEWVALKSV